MPKEDLIEIVFVLDKSGSMESRHRETTAGFNESVSGKVRVNFENESMFQYWGKAERNDSSGGLWHPLVYHSLDVAAVGKVLLERDVRLRGNMTRLLCMPEEIWIPWFCFFLTIHDLGKFSRTFQNLRPDILPHCRGEASNQPYAIHHSSLGFIFWEHQILNLAEKESWFGSRSEVIDLSDIDLALNLWVNASAGHHGEPPSVSYQGGPVRPTTYFSQKDMAAAETFTRWAHHFFNPRPFDFPGGVDPYYDQWKKASWMLAGLAVLCDWLGSNKNYFRFCGEQMPLENYFGEKAFMAASNILKDTGLIPIPVSQQGGFGILFPSLEKRNPSPLQDFAGRIEIAPEPSLFLLEDVTGSGKTEAALLLSHRLMQIGAADGIVLALPTMATANAMYTRLSSCHRRFFSEAHTPSLALAHSATKLMKLFGRTILPKQEASTGQYADMDVDASTYCNAWIAEGRKRAFLADVGVCTIDQALLAVLPSRHQSLRLLGLSRKVLLIDEVHAYDPYMNALIEALLEFQAGLGGSAILLSATLPQATRRAFFNAFARGLGRAPLSLSSSCFPLVTKMAEGDPTEHPVATRPEVARRVSVRFLHTEETVVAHIAQVASEGKCVCWVRNTVGDAMIGYQALQALVPQENIRLFHARFAMSDRLEREDEVIARFGEKSRSEQRQGQILIATQVVEQSLDLDFDVMVIDLAPMDLIIQRAGRLARHTRDSSGNPIHGPDARGVPCLYILSPELDAAPGPDWYRSLFRNGAFIYPNHARLWLTAELLRKMGGWTMPKDSRDLIEGVFGDKVEVPEGLTAFDFKAGGEGMAKRSAGRMNTLDFVTGYIRTDGQWLEDTVVPTRLGEKSSTLVLMKWDGQNLSPWREGEDWHLGQVNVLHVKVAEEFGAEGTDIILAKKGLKELRPDLKYCVLIAMTPSADGIWVGKAANKQGNRVDLVYSNRFGLNLATGKDSDEL